MEFVDLGTMSKHDLMLIQYILFYVVYSLGSAVDYRTLYETFIFITLCRRGDG